MAIIELSTALVAAGSGVVVPFVNKVLEKSAQRVGGHVDEHLAALFTRAYDYLAPTGREPQPIEAKIAIPLMQAAVLETNTTLINRWAALLANAVDPAQQAPVQPGFAEVLRQLTPMDAQLFDALVTIKTEPQIHLPNLVPVFILQRAFEPISKQDINLSISNLTRLGLTLTAGQQPLIESTPLVSAPRGLSTVGPGIDHVRLTPFGNAFLASVTPPTL
jgi:hypothetical protein